MGFEWCSYCFMRYDGLGLPKWDLLYSIASQYIPFLVGCWLYLGFKDLTNKNRDL